MSYVAGNEQMEVMEKSRIIEYYNTEDLTKIQTIAYIWKK